MIVRKIGWCMWLFCKVPINKLGVARGQAYTTITCILVLACALVNELDVFVLHLCRSI